MVVPSPPFRSGPGPAIEPLSKEALRRAALDARKAFAGTLSDGDRALIHLRKSGARLVGVGWPIQRLTEAIPADDWDVPLDAFASPDGLELFSSR